MTITDNDAAQLKAEAIAARRAARPAWQNAHIDRLIRDREAREISREYRKAQAGTKQCSSCSQTLPLDCFSPAFRDRPTARCKACVAASTRKRYQADLTKARSRTRNRLAYVPRPRDTSERSRKAADRRQQIEDQKRQKVEARQREAAERVTHLAALLLGTIPGQRISSEESWNVASTELKSLWLLSGDKECISCREVVPPTAMHPPGPANFYPGKCRRCAHNEYRETQLRVYGKVSEGAPLIPMRDGSSITVAELARRHGVREGRLLSPQISETA